MGKQKFCLQRRPAIDGPTGVDHGLGRQQGIGHSNRQQARRCRRKHHAGGRTRSGPAQLKVIEKNVVEKKADGKKLDARIEDILSAEDEELSGGLDDLDLDDDAGGATSPSSPTTKACPYCGEQILAVAVKCKHCGSYVGEKAAKPRQPSGEVASQGVPMRVWAIVGGVVAVVVLVPIVIVVAWIMWSGHAAPPVVPAIPEPVAVSPPPASPAAAPPPKPQAYKPLPEEMAFALKLTAFLDGCDELANLLEKAPKMEQFNKQCEATKSRFAAIPPPPQGLSWASEAVAASKRMLDALNMTTMELTTLDAAMEALHQSMSDSPDAREACHKAAEEMRKRHHRQDDDADRQRQLLP